MDINNQLVRADLRQINLATLNPTFVSRTQDINTIGNDSKAYNKSFGSTLAYTN